MKIFSSKFSSGATALVVSGLVCKALGAFFRLPLTNLLGIEGIGVFQLVMALYAFALVLTCGGVTTSLSKLISSSRAKGNNKVIGCYLKRSLFVSVGIGILLGLLFLLLGKNICALQSIAYNKSYWLFVLLLPLGAGLSSFRGFFQGYENMIPTAVSQVVEQVFKFAFGLLFAFYFGKFGTSEGVFGAFLGITLSEVVALGVLFIWFAVKNKNFEKINELQKVKFAHKEFDKANFLLTISASILPLVSAFDGLVVVQRFMLAGYTAEFSTKLFGLQTGVVGALLNFPLIISMSVSTALLPNISYLLSKGSGGKSTIEKGLKVLLFLILPSTFGIVAITKPLLSLVYDGLNGYLLDLAFNLMFYGAFSIIFTAIMQFAVMLLQANGEFKFILFATLLGGIFKAVITFFLSSVSSINVFALVLGNIALYATGCILTLAKLKNSISFRITFGEILTILFATLSMFLVVFTFENCNYFSEIANLVIGVILGVVAYAVLSAPVLFGLFSKKSLQKSKKVV